MDRLARLILRGRFPAGLIAAALFLATAFLPAIGGLLLLVAAAPAALIAWQVGVRGLLEAGGVAAVVIGLVSHGLAAPVLWLGALWLPVGLGAYFLRQGPHFAWVSLGMAGITLVAMAGVIGYLSPDPIQNVEQRLNGLLDQRLAQIEGPEDQAQRAEAELESVIPPVARVLPGSIAGGVLLFWWINLGVGLRLAAALEPIPDMGSALRAFRLPDSLVWALLGLGLLGWLAWPGGAAYWAFNAIGVLAVLYFAQGLAVVHAARLAFGLGRGWLVAFYVLIGILIQMVLAVALLGLADVWADFRRRFAAA